MGHVEHGNCSSQLEVKGLVGRSVRGLEHDLLTVGAVAERTGVATSALRYYEDQGPIASSRSDADQRRLLGARGWKSRAAGSDHHNGKSSRVLHQRGKQLHVVTVARDDLHIVADGKIVGLGRDDRIDTGWRRIEASANRVLPKRAGRVAELRVHVDDMREVQQSAHVIVVAEMAGEDALSEHRSGYDQVRGVLSQDTEARPSMFVQRSNAFDPAGVENDDHPAAR